VTFANGQKPDLFVSVHANSMPTKRQRQRTEGIETFFLSANASGDDARKTADRENAEAPRAASVAGDDTLSYILADLQRAEAHVDSSRLAYAIHQKLISTTGATDRGVQQAPFYVLMGVDAPAVLVEVGFISHPKEGKRLGDPKYQVELAGAIASGVSDFLEQVRTRDVQQAAVPPK
jgi:N-acetylmuramoyl-L-alanine amidase